MRRVIINADDFGINSRVTEEIEKMVVEKAISSTTIMANGDYLDEVKRFVPGHPEISFGVHLCLTEFSSLTNSSILRDYGIIDSDGNFVYKAIFNQRTFDEKMFGAIKDELNAQIETVKSLGIQISHADSHHHVHTIYPLKEVFADVLKKQGINKIRLGVDFDSWRSRRHLLLWYKRNQLNDYYRSLFITTDKFASYTSFVDSKGKCKDNKAIELMCHPGHPGVTYKKEMELVAEKTLLQNEMFKLVSYNDI